MFMDICIKVVNVFVIGKNHKLWHFYGMLKSQNNEWTRLTYFVHHNLEDSKYGITLYNSRTDNTQYYLWIHTSRSIKTKTRKTCIKFTVSVASGGGKENGLGKRTKGNSRQGLCIGYSIVWNYLPQVSFLATFTIRLSGPPH